MTCDEVLSIKEKSCVVSDQICFLLTYTSAYIDSICNYFLMNFLHKFSVVKDYFGGIVTVQSLQ